MTGSGNRKSRPGVRQPPVTNPSREPVEHLLQHPWVCFLLRCGHGQILRPRGLAALPMLCPAPVSPGFADSSELPTVAPACPPGGILSPNSALGFSTFLAPSLPLGPYWPGFHAVPVDPGAAGVWMSPTISFGICWPMSRSWRQ